MQVFRTCKANDGQIVLAQIIIWEIFTPFLLLLETTYFSTPGMFANLGYVTSADNGILAEQR